jgi:predicted acetyltransferase
VIPELIEPDVRVHRSFLAAMAELRADGYGGPRDMSTIGSDMRAHSGTWDTEHGFATYVALVRSEAEGRNLPPDYVPSTSLWWVDGATYLGRIHIRHELTDSLRDFGGHIGYYVRPSARRQGHATAMLRAALPFAADLGIDSALITCDVRNAASRKVIEANGGVFEDERNGRLRYWVATRP